MSKKIAIIGSGSTGKTTLINEVQRRTGCNVVPEIIRELVKELGLEHLENLTPEETVNLEKELLRRKIELESRMDSFIADRSTLDNLAYTLINSRRVFPKDELFEFTQTCITHTKNTYDHIIFLPFLEIPFVDDGFRLPISDEILCNFALLGMLESEHISYISYDGKEMSSLAARVNAVIDLMSKGY